MNLNKYYKILICIYIIFYGVNGYSQHLTDYLTYYLSDTSTKRQTNFVNNDQVGDDDAGERLAYDGKNIYLVNNFAGDIDFSSYFHDTSLKEKPYIDINFSQIYFCKYNIKNHSLVIKPFGSNYLNKVWLVKIDEQNKSICTILSTCDDTVRLNPSNQNEYISFADRKERLWLVVLDTEGKLLSKLLIAEYNLPNPLIRPSYIHKISILGNFNYLEDIIFPFKTINANKILPDNIHDSIKLSNNVRYIVNFNSKNGNIKWIRKLETSNQVFLGSEINGVHLAACVQLSKHDSIINFADIYGKNILQYNFKEEKIPDSEFITYIFKFDTWGNMSALFNVISKGIYTPEDRTIVEQLIQNNNKIIALISSNNDSIKIFNKYYMGKIDPILPYTKNPKKVYLLEIDLNSQNAKSLLNNKNDSVVALKILKADRGFYILYRYSNSATNYNLFSGDTIINLKDDDYFKYPDNLTFHTICKYDSIYKIKWINKGYIKNIFDFGNLNIIFSYFSSYPRNFDIDLRAESIGKINPMPIMINTAIYNCKPLSYYQSSKVAINTFKFTNLSEYNCSYKWDFGDGVTTTQKSPTHKFKSSTSSYKVSLIVTNECGSDTFFRYFDVTSGIALLPNKSSIKVYPNPVYGNSLKIEVSYETEIKSIKIYNTTGQQLDECSFEQTSKGNFTATINSKLSKGIYFLRVITGDNTAFVSKLMVD